MYINFAFNGSLSAELDWTNHISEDLDGFLCFPLEAGKAGIKQIQNVRISSCLNLPTKFSRQFC